MIKNFSKIFALILTLIFSASYYTQTLTFSSTNPAVAPANVTLGSIKVPIYSAKIVASGFNGAGANLSSVSFTPTGTFLNSDITRYQFWYNTTNDLTTATNTGPDITAIPTQGTQVTLSPYNPYLGDGKTWYIWITADIKTSAVAGRTLTVGALSTSNFNFSSGSKTGTMSVGGTQTFGSDSDGDGIPDSTDLDDDNDGILDRDEAGCAFTGINLQVSSVGITNIVRTKSTVNAINYGEGNGKRLTDMTFIDGSKMTRIAEPTSTFAVRRNSLTFGGFRAYEVIYAESLASGGNNILISHPTNMEELLEQGYLNAGIDNTFQNTSSQNGSNIERLDIL